MTIYFLSGLGADNRAFKYLTFPANTEIVFIDWLIPEKNEPLRSYAKRIAEKIDHSKPFILVGLSFGGILATEILEFITPQKTILLSSVTRRQELPFYYRMVGFFKLNKIIPLKSTNKINFLTNWVFGISAPKDKLLLAEILAATNSEFSRWAVNEILNWKRTVTPSNLIRIHGNKDRVLPMIKFKPDYLIKDGGHLIVVTQAKEISKILEAAILEV
ncbi:alpha/beta fold hydrolase [Ferruginibacter sp.]